MAQWGQSLFEFEFTKILTTSFALVALEITMNTKLGSVAGPVIQANGRLSFEDDLRSGGLLYCVSQ